MMQEIQLSENLEDYLETILALESAHKVARAKDIADNLGLQRGSVTSALKSLAERELIHYEPYSFITLTRQGKQIACEITRRHQVIRDFLVNVLQLEPVKADANACRIEHAVDRETTDRLLRFIQHLEKHPQITDGWLPAAPKSEPGKKTDQAT